MEELPADFWDSPAAGAPEASSAGIPARTAASRVAADESQAPEPPEPEAGARTPVSEQPESSDDEVAPPTDLEQAFDQLQSLFPGRVVEVRPPASEEAPLDGVTEPLHDELVAEGGYDDDDQDRLPFGPGSN